MMEKEKETQGFESTENSGVEQQNDTQDVKGDVAEKPDLFRKISDAIPQRHVNKLLWFLLTLILLGLGLQIYNTIWGNPRERAERKKFEEENALLQKKADEQKAQARMLEDGSVVPDDLLEGFDDTTSSDELFEAYGKTIEVDEGELN